VNLQESDTGAVLVEEEEVIQKKQADSKSNSNLQVFNSVAAQKEGVVPWTHSSQRMLPISDPSIFTIKQFTTPWQRPLYGHVGRLDCLMNVMKELILLL
jgi:hypothetical protein